MKPVPQHELDALGAELGSVIAKNIDGRRVASLVILMSPGDGGEFTYHISGNLEDPEDLLAMSLDACRKRN